MKYEKGEGRLNDWSKINFLISTISDHSIKEYYYFISNMVYSIQNYLFKHSKFYPDASLELLFFCKQHNAIKHLNNEQEPWMWVYGLDKVTMRDILKGEKSRYMLAKVHWETYFDSKLEETVLKIKPEYKDMISQNFNSCKVLKKKIKIIEKKWNINFILE